MSLGLMREVFAGGDGDNGWLDGGDEWPEGSQEFLATAFSGWFFRIEFRMSAVILGKRRRDEKETGQRFG